MSQDALKRQAAEAALAMVEDGMALGLGSGSTAEIFVALLGEKVKAGLKVAGAPTSQATARAAEAAGVPLLAPDAADLIDLTIDGTDEVDPEFRLIKGGGGCLLREKIIAAASRKMVVIADASKQVAQLGAFPLPVEVDPFWRGVTARHISAALGDTGCEGRGTRLRLEKGSDEPFVTDGGNHILDCDCNAIPAPEATAAALAEIPGVVEHGLFLGLAQTVILGSEGGARILERG